MPVFQYGGYRSPYVQSISALLEAPGQIEAQRAQTVGNAQARAAQQSGQAWAGAAQGVGNVLEQYQRMREEAPLKAAQLAATQSQTGERNSLTAERNQQTTARTQAGVDSAVVGKILGEGGDLASIKKALTGTPEARLIPQIEKSFEDAAKRKADFDKVIADTAKSSADTQAAQEKIAEAHANYLGGLSADVAKHDYDPTAFFHAVALAHKDGMIDTQTAGQAIALGIQTPDQIKPFVDARIAASPEQRKILEAAAAKAAVPPKQYEVTVPGPNGQPIKKLVSEAALQAGVPEYKAPPASTASPSALNDVKDAVAGMMEGTIPPMLPGRASKEYLATLAEAKRQGYDLQAAVTDWNATQKHIATMNGAQQLRLNQSINALPELLDTVDDLASKWKGGRFPTLNKANLALAKGGAYGDEVATIARQLDSQIADVTADLGSVYMGGNSPTDHALELAGKSLAGEWSEKVLRDMVALARKNVTIRRNSINNTGVQGVGSENPYVPPPVVPPPVTPPTQPKIVRYDMSGKVIP